MGVLSRSDILKADDLPRERVAVPEWGGDVFVRALSGTERDGFEASIVVTRGKDTSMNMSNIRAKLAALAMCDEAGAQLFEERDVVALGQKSASGLQRVFEVAQRLSGIGEEAVKELGEGLKVNPLGGSISG